MRITTTSTGNYRPSDADIPLNQWSHVAGVYDGSTIRLYINGVEIGKGTSHSGVIANSGRDFAIGAHRDSPNTRRFQGKIDEVHIYDRALSPEEVAALVSQEPHALAPNQAPVVVAGLDQDVFTRIAKRLI